MRAAGEAEGAWKKLQEALDGGRYLGDREVWTSWAALGLADLGLSPSQVLGRFPRGGEASGPGGDIRWLLERLAAREPIRIDSGGEDGSESSGAWRWDSFFLGGFKNTESYKLPGGVISDLVIPPTSFQSDIVGTVEHAVYRTFRWFPDEDLEHAAYRIHLPRGAYQVTLHFAEVWLREPGQRSFDVFIEGKKVLEDYDPVARAGFAAADREVFEDVGVEDGVLDIEFVRKAHRPFISAIEVKPAAAK